MVVCLGLFNIQSYMGVGVQGSGFTTVRVYGLGLEVRMACSVSGAFARAWGFGLCLSLWDLRLMA